jgi:hypothetical protein
MSADSTCSQVSTPDSHPSGLEAAALLRINQVLDRFEDAWKRGEPIPLEDLMRGETGSERAVLFRYALAVELSYRHRRGDVPTSAEYVPRFPEDAAVIQHIFAKQTSILDPTSNSRGSSLLDLIGASLSSAAGPQPLPDRIGKYQVLGRLGRGGQGAAYLARDTEIGHLVVLKRYHTAAADGGAEAARQDGEALTRVHSRYTPHCNGLERHGHGVHRGSQPVRDQPDPSPDAPGRRAGDRAGGRGPGGGPRLRDAAPRHQAREHRAGG